MNVSTLIKRAMSKRPIAAEEPMVETTKATSDELEHSRGLSRMRPAMIDRSREALERIGACLEAIVLHAAELDAALAAADVHDEESCERVRDVSASLAAVSAQQAIDAAGEALRAFEELRRFGEGEARAARDVLDPRRVALASPIAAASLLTPPFAERLLNGEADVSEVRSFLASTDGHRDHCRYARVAPVAKVFFLLPILEAFERRGLVPVHGQDVWLAQTLPELKAGAIVDWTRRFVDLAPAPEAHLRLFRAQLQRVRAAAAAGFRTLAEVEKHENEQARQRQSGPIPGARIAR